MHTHQADDTEPALPRQTYNASNCGRWIRALQTALASLYKANNARLIRQTAILKLKDPSWTATIDEGNSGRDSDHLFGIHAKSRVTYGARRIAGRKTCGRTASHLESTPKRIGISVALPTPFRSTKSTVCDERIPKQDSTKAESSASRCDPSNRLDDCSPRRIGRMVVDAFERLISVTTSRAHSKLGAKSLLSTAIGQLPRYAQHESVVRQTLDPDDHSDVLMELLDWIDELSQVTGLKQNDLADAAKSLGCSLVCQAIQDDMLEPHLVQEIVSKCFKAGALTATDSVVKAYARSRAVRSGNSIWHHGRTLKCIERSGLNAIKVVVDATDQHVSLFGRSREYIEDKNTPKFVLASLTTAGLRGAAVRAVIFHRPFWNDALCYLEAVLIRACGLDPRTGDILHISDATRAALIRDSVNSTAASESGSDQELWKKLNASIQELCIIIVSMAVIGQAKGFHSEQRIDFVTPLRAVRGAAKTLLRFFNSEAIVTEAINCGTDAVASAVLLADAVACILGLVPDDEQLVNSTETLAKLRLTIKLNKRRSFSSSAMTVSTSSMTNFLRDLALTCDEHLPGNGLHILQLVTQQLLGVRFEDELSANAVSQIALDAALAFAMKNPAPQHKRLANELESLCQNCLASKTNNAVRRGDMRWDEGLCEWVRPRPLNNSIPSQIHRKRSRSGSHELERVVHVAHKQQSWDELADESAPSDIIQISSQSDKIFETPIAKRRHLGSQGSGNSLEEDDEDELAIGYSTRKADRTSRSRRP